MNGWTRWISSQLLTAVPTFLTNQVRTKYIGVSLPYLDANCSKWEQHTLTGRRWERKIHVKATRREGGGRDSKCSLWLETQSMDCLQFQPRSQLLLLLLLVLFDHCRAPGGPLWAGPIRATSSLPFPYPSSPFFAFGSLFGLFKNCLRGSPFMFSGLEASPALCKGCSWARRLMALWSKRDTYSWVATRVTNR